ncbi:MAG: NADH-quinone oxidoreductase subunit A [Planctomycetaceae bacterium]
MTNLVGHLLLFGSLVCVLLALPIFVGRWVRPRLPTPEKDAIYECGEPAIGSSYIQFDLRFYVVALLFIVFDVEVAFFFPWAAVYGHATQLADPRLSDAARHEISARLIDRNPADMVPSDLITAETAKQLMLTGFFDILVFFVVLLVGFAYVWKRGDLDWIRAVAQKSRHAADQTASSENRSSSVAVSA